MRGCFAAAAAEEAEARPPFAAPEEGLGRERGFGGANEAPFILLFLPSSFWLELLLPPPRRALAAGAVAEAPEARLWAVLAFPPAAAATARAVGAAIFSAVSAARAAASAEGMDVPAGSCLPSSPPLVALEAD